MRASREEPVSRESQSMEWKDKDELLAKARAHREGQEAHAKFGETLRQWTTYFQQMTATVLQMSDAQLQGLAAKYQEASTSLISFRVAAEGHAARGFGRDFLQAVDYHVQDMNSAALSCAQMLANRRKAAADMGAIMREAHNYSLDSQMRANRYQSQVYEAANQRYLDAQRNPHLGACGSCRGRLDPFTRWEYCPHCGVRLG